MQEQRLLLGETLFEVVALEHPGHAQLGGDLDKAADVEPVHPFAIEADFGQRGSRIFETCR